MPAILVYQVNAKLVSSHHKWNHQHLIEFKYFTYLNDSLQQEIPFYLLCSLLEEEAGAPDRTPLTAQSVMTGALFAIAYNYTGWMATLFKQQPTKKIRPSVYYTSLALPGTFCYVFGEFVVSTVQFSCKLRSWMFLLSYYI